MLELQARRIGACFTAASLFEVCIYPSPGLVNPHDSGAHHDMNLFTFIIGSSVLSPYFTALAKLGAEQSEAPVTQVFASMRKLGIQAEADLLRATSGVNTQRGQLFILGLASGLAGICLSRGYPVPSPQFYDLVREACQGLAAQELSLLKEHKAKTTGERLYVANGYTGVRGEAEAGFPTVEHVGYPALLAGLSHGLSLNDAAVHSLITIMSVLVDTTVLGRRGEAGLATLHTTAREILAAGSVFTKVGRELISSAHTLFCAERISPGGCADLLSLSMALHFLGQGFPGPKVLLAPSLFER